jgi:flagellar biosynthesis protein FlhF
MQLKNYEAQSIQEAMAMIRKELGDDAIILSTNRKGSLFEVIAARDGDEPFPMPALPVSEKRTPPNGLPEGSLNIGRLLETMETMFDILGSGTKSGGDDLAPLYYRFVTAGMSKPSACKLADIMRARPETDACTALKNSLPPYGKRKRIRVLVGPTGVGKTTTLAKLAAETAFGKKQSTAIITTDTHRIAAPEQIKIYAKIMDIPMAVAPDRPAYMKAIARFTDREVIYVDTPGRSHSDQGALEALSAILGSADDMETSLVLSLTSAREHLLASAKRYKMFDSSNIIFTKLDECSRYGAIYDVVEKTGIPVSYVTMGQNVPEDIERATPDRIADIILGR